MQFTMVDYSLYKKELSCDQVMVFSLIVDRMKSSVKDSRFFDKKMNDSYVIFTATELSTMFKGSEHKFRNVLTSLTKLGMIISKRQRNRPNKLFVPRFDELMAEQDAPEELGTSESANQVRQKVTTNQTTKSKNITNDTSHTADVHEEPIDMFKVTITNTIGISSLAVERILQFANYKIETANKVIGTILKAKSVVAKKNNLLNSKVSRFEHNTNLINGLSSKLSHIFSYAKNSDNQLAYIFRSLKSYFEEAFGLVKPEIVTPATKSEPKSSVVQPEWLDNPEAWDANEPVATDADRKYVAEMLKRFE